MSDKRKAAIITVAVLLIIVLAASVLYKPAQKNPADSLATETNKSTNNLQSDETTAPESEQPQSPYMDMWLYRSVIPVDPFHLILSNVTATVASQPDVAYVATFDVADELIITMPAPSDVNIEDVSLIGVAHANMKDPYLTPISEYEKMFTVPFVEGEDGWYCTVKLDYDDDIEQGIDVFFMYKDSIEAYSMFKVTDMNQSSTGYWQKRFPDEKIGTFYITCGDESTTYCFIDSNTTLLDWITQDMNVDGWYIKDTYMVNRDKTWMIALSSCEKLVDGVTLNAEPYKEVQVEPVVFDAQNPQYAVSYLGKSYEDILATFGEPVQTTIRGDATKVEYPQATFYIMASEGVIQIDVLKEQLPPINALPASPVTTMQLLNCCMSLGLDLPNSIEEQDASLSMYKVVYPFTNDGWTVAYVWESDEPIITGNTACSRIIVYSGDNYIF